MSGDILDSYNFGAGVGAADMWWVEGREALNILQGTGEPPTTQNRPAQNRNSAKVEEAAPG